MTTVHLRPVQRLRLQAAISGPIQRLGTVCAPVWEDPASVDQLLAEHLERIPRCRLLYALDTGGIRRSANVPPRESLPDFRGQNLTRRAFWEGPLPSIGPALSPVYLDRDTFTPYVTMMQPVRLGSTLLGYLAADFGLNALPAQAALGGPEQEQGAHPHPCIATLKDR
ncbi:PDC sensor domain-containing protein [Thiohalorhabdus methylotrophus]|uniref:PDC sensor domain-containing protein n=1 Tax=Thiohalorhabdus methylotrophus TaxID=3242694 RepID=A0ABV4U1U1_9GAMM